MLESLMTSPLMHSSPKEVPLILYNISYLALQKILLYDHQRSTATS